MGGSAARFAAGAGSTRTQFCVAALAGLLWNAFGCLDYLLTQIRYSPYIQPFPPQMMPWIDAFPWWATTAWGLGAGLSLAGSILLLLRSSRAAPAFLASFAFAAASMGYRHFSGEMPAPLDTVGRWAIDLSLLAVIAVQRRYARCALR